MGDITLKLENVIAISYYMLDNLFIVYNHSDLWIPIGLDDNYQIDLALANAPRLRECLEEIKEIGTYRCIFPDVDEPGMGTIPQRGFHMFAIECDVTDREDFPWDRYEEIKGFLLKCY